MFESYVDILADFVEKSLRKEMAAAFWNMSLPSCDEKSGRKLGLRFYLVRNSLRLCVVLSVNRFRNDIAPVEGSAHCERVPTHEQYVCNKPRSTLSWKNRSLGGPCISTR